MTIPLYLAMTAEEYADCGKRPGHIAWMACHFSPYGTGIINLPPRLPSGSMVILNDRIPIDRHDPQVICKQLQSFGCSALLLDFQRSGVAETKKLVSYLLSDFTCSVGVSPAYADGHSCPVFLPPIPPHVSPAKRLLPYYGREIWLEVALGTTIVKVTDKGADFQHSAAANTNTQRYDESLCCSYSLELSGSKATFALQRRKEDISKLLEACKDLGVTKGIGLYQELK